MVAAVDIKNEIGEIGLMFPFVLGGLGSELNPFGREGDGEGDREEPDTRSHTIRGCLDDT